MLPGAVRGALAALDGSDEMGRMLAQTFEQLRHGELTEEGVVDPVGAIRCL